MGKDNGKAVIVTYYKYAQQICRESKPELEDIGSGSFVRCHCYRDLTLLRENTKGENP